jgi:hypothetical protein
MPITILLERVAYGVQKQPDGNKTLHFQDKQSGMVVTVPLGTPDCEKIAKLLTDSRIMIVNGMPGES